jgi:hypothetical protein
VVRTAFAFAVSVTLTQQQPRVERPESEPGEWRADAAGGTAAGRASDSRGGASVGR